MCNLHYGFRQLKLTDKKKLTKSFDSDRAIKSPDVKVKNDTAQPAESKASSSITRTRQVSAPAATAIAPKRAVQPNLHLVIPNESRPPIAGVTNTVSPSISPKQGGTAPSHSPHSSDISPLINQLKPPIFIRKGAKGFGFTIRTIRVYLGQSEYYTMQHIVTVRQFCKKRKNLRKIQIFYFKGCRIAQPGYRGWSTSGRFNNPRQW